MSAALPQLIQAPKPSNRAAPSFRFTLSQPQDKDANPRNKSPGWLNFGNRTIFGIYIAENN
jgi:hypothetical protein